MRTQTSRCNQSATSESMIAPQVTSIDFYRMLREIMLPLHYRESLTCYKAFVHMAVPRPTQYTVRLSTEPSHGSCS